ncbi:acyl-CoA dehydrogenase family protein [Streptomyces sp. NPDC052101]|uniref:acyl-CoA dehydrogenase family protein n=1 Tax=Streptomyces sp. NPDC052101 TaxID=3155763 RepID=UPI00342D1647
MTATLQETARPSAESVAALRASGVLGTVIPRVYGGRGGDAVQANRAVTDLARRDPSLGIVLFQHLAVSARITEWGTVAQKAAILPRLASGEWLAASAWSETGAGAAKKSLTTTAEQHTGGWALTGTKAFVTGAGIADLYLVLAQSEQSGDDDTVYGSSGQTLFLVPAATPGLSVGSHVDMDGMRRSATGSVRLNGCVLPSDNVLGGAGIAATIIRGVRESGATLGAVSLGIAEAAWDCVEAHLAKAGTSQATQYRLVDLAARLEAVRGCIERAGRRDSANPGTTVLYSKLFASAETEEICAQAQRLLGSAGYLQSHRVNALARDARAIALMGPTNELCRELVSAAWTA